MSCPGFKIQKKAALQLIKRIAVFILSGLLSCFTSIAQETTNTSGGGDKAMKQKAAFIYNFTNYVFWPQENELKEFTICMMGNEPLIHYMNMLAGQVKFRNQVPVKIVSCKNVAELLPCQVLVVDGSQHRNTSEIYAAISGKHVLMIAENLKDYTRSMISITDEGGKMKYIVNRSRIKESGLSVKKLLYDLAISGEAEWKTSFDKFNLLLKSQDKEIKVDKAELEKMLNMYNSLEKEKHNKDIALTILADSMNNRMKELIEKTEEYKKISREIEKDRQTLYDQQRKISKQKKQLYNQGSKISQQKMVIIIICILSSFVLLLLFYTVRINRQRVKAHNLLAKRKTEIERQKQIVDEKQKEILDSIYYAKRIQKALMANDKVMNDHLKEYFVLFKPKDIVAGDFYWAAHLPDSFLYATGDSTGHGVPGAFMSLLNITKLNEAVNQKHIYRPDLILNDVRENIISALNPEGSQEESKDGMDAILCRIDFKNMKLQFSAANSNFCIIRNREILNLKADKMPVGKSNDDDKPFTYNEIALQKGDMIYTFSDGYGDQFGGPKGKKFKSRMLREVLVKISELSPETQRAMLERQLDDWMGHLEQVDDVLVIGVRV